MAGDLTEEGFQASEVLSAIGSSFEGASDAEKKAQIKKVNAIFEMQLKNGAGKQATWTIDLKKTGTVYKGPAKPKADVTIIMDDATFVDLATGKLDGQKAFMTGKLKAKGNIMLATKLDSVFKANKAKAKL
ncbi:sterol-binding protein [Auricularia subglabra TFB-10046 SS5]|nr:sterol-binding protein [Auricularia subglabra TFB-10046 SS5]